MTVKVPLVFAVHDRFEVPDPETVVGVRVHVIPLRLTE